MPKKIKQLPEPSKEFWDAVISSGSSQIIKCDFCGRVHYSTEEPGNYEEGELEKLEKKTRKNPDKYLEHSEMIHGGYVDGKQAVYGCPCNKASIYEKLFWNNRFLISRYFTKQAEKIRKFSKQTDDLVNKVRDSIIIQ